MNQSTPKHRGRPRIVSFVRFLIGRQHIESTERAIRAQLTMSQNQQSKD